MCVVYKEHYNDWYYGLGIQTYHELNLSDLLDFAEHTFIIINADT